MTFGAQLGECQTIKVVVDRAWVRDETRRCSLVRNISNLQDGTERCSNLAWSYLCNGVDEVLWLCFWFSKKKIAAGITNKLFPHN